MEKILKIFKKLNTNLVIYILSFIVNILLYLAIFSKITSNGIEIYFNSDALYFPTLFKDLFKDGYKFKGWWVPGAPGFLPDMLLYFILMIIFNNHIYASFFYGIVQFIIILFLINWLINIISGKKNLTLNTLVNLSMSLFLLVSVTDSDFWLTFLIISNTYHLGAFVLALLSLCLTLKFFLEEKTIILYILFIISSLSFFSDKLYAFMFNIPLLTSIIFFKSNKGSIVKRILFVNVSSVILGYLFFIGLKSLQIIHFDNVEKLIDFSRFNLSLKLFINFLTNMFNAKLVNKIIFTFSFSSLILIIIYFFKDFKKYFFSKNNQTDDLSKTRYFYFSFLLAYTLILTLAPILSGIYLDNSGIRYNISTFYILTFNLFPIIYFINSKIKDIKIINFTFLNFSFLIILIFIFIFLKNFNKKGLKDYFNYYPTVAECIDNYIDKNKNIYGISSYWIGKVAMNFSKKQARIYSVYDESFYPLPHVGNENWYIVNNGKYNNPIFSFVIVEKSHNLNNLMKNYGEPTRIDSCDRYYILTYPEFKFNHKFEPYFINIKNKKILLEDFEEKLNDASCNITDKYAFSGKYSHFINSEKEYSFAHTIIFEELKNKNINKAYVKVHLLFEKLSEVNIVFSIDEPNKNIVWKSLNVNKSIYELNKWQEFVLTADIPDNLSDKAIIKAYIWNYKKGEVFIDDLILEFH